MKASLKLLFVFLFLSMLIFKPTSSYAYWHGHSYVGINLGVWPGPYYGYPYGYYPYYGDSYYYLRPVVIDASSYQPVVVNGVTYYENNGVFYLYTQYGYQAVATPAGISAPTTVVPSSPGANSDDSYSINIPNNKGGFTAVVIKKSGHGFIGPQGEYYSEFPKVSQLQVMYGK